jgi:hypothetical protein
MLLSSPSMLHAPPISFFSVGSEMYLKCLITCKRWQLLIVCHNCEFAVTGLTFRSICNISKSYS